MIIRKIARNYGIMVRAGNYTVFREVPFNVGKENEYIKDMNEGFYGTLVQAIIGMRKMIHRDEENEHVKTLDEAIQLIKDIDAEIINFMTENNDSIRKRLVEASDGGDDEEIDNIDENINGDEL